MRIEQRNAVKTATPVPICICMCLEYICILYCMLYIFTYYIFTIYIVFIFTYIPSAGKTSSISPLLIIRGGKYHLDTFLSLSNA